MTQREEIELAVKEKRQPICVYCNEPLDKVEQREDHYNQWTWYEDLKGYLRGEEWGNPDEEPYHVNCDVADSELILNDEAHERIGLIW